MRFLGGKPGRSLQQTVLTAEYRRGLRDAAGWLLGRAHALGATFTKRSSSRTIDVWLERTVEWCMRMGSGYIKCAWVP